MASNMRFPRRSAPPVRPLLVADGLLVTDDAAWAWFHVPTAATDWLTEADQDAGTDQAASDLSRLFDPGTELHLKVLWGRLSAADYTAGIRRSSARAAGHAESWTRLAAERIESLALPERHVLLGARIAARDTHAGWQRATRTAERAFGVAGAQVGHREATGYAQRAAALARRLDRSVFHARPAPAELIAWSLSRELARTDAWVPAGEAITGPRLARVLSGRVIPHADCVEVAGARSQAFVAVLVASEFPEELVVPGGEWLLRLGELEGCSVDFSCRFTVLTGREAIGQARDTETLGKEQERSAAAGRAGEAPLEVTETVEAMREVIRDVTRSGVSMVVDDPRWIVAADTPERLDEHVDALVQLYGGMGIDLFRLPYRQGDLWLEALPGDRRRVAEFSHTRTATALAGSWFWGGSAVGDDTGPYLGVLTGSTPGIVRIDLLAASARGDATTTVLVGRSGRGKTTTMMMLCLHAAHADAWVTFLDVKGDCTGLVHQATANGLPAELVRLGADYAGVLDPFGYQPPEDAKLEAAAICLALLHPRRRAAAEEHITRAVNTVAREPNPALWQVITRLRAGATPSEREVGAELGELADNPLGKPVAGKLNTGAVGLGTSRGLRVIQIPGITLPSAGAAEETWTLRQRLSVMLFRAAIGYTGYVGGTLRGMAKVIAVPELHLITRSADGRAFVDATARLGRALQTNLILDTQVAADLTGMDGVREQATTVIAFQAVTATEQDAVTELLGLQPDEHVRRRLGNLGQIAGGPATKGHAVMRDWRGRVATVQFDLITDQIRTTLSTTPPTDTPEHLDDARHTSTRPGDRGSHP